MVLQVLKFAFIGLIAAPFVYMIFEVTLDVLKRFYGFYKREAKPVLVRVTHSFKKHESS